MNRYLITAAVLSISWISVTCEANLQQINASHDDLNPLNEEANLTAKGQEKRTIFNPTIKNYAWAKHVGIRPTGTKYLLGYSPVDLKYRPVLRPLSISHQGYHYDRPKFHFQLKKPVIHIPQVKPVLHTEWKPVVKPAVPIHVPPPSHLLTKPARPVVHVDHIDEIKEVGHSDHLHLNPVPHLDHIHAQKVPTVHVDHVHQLPVPHVDHAHKVTQLVHVQQVPVAQHVHQVPLAQVDHVHQVPVSHVPHQVPWHPVNTVQAAQLVPQNPHIVQQTQFVPSAQLFEVTKPDLGVLPLGAVFQSPVLRDIPAPQFKPALVHQHLVPAVPPVQHIHPVPTPSIHLQQAQPVTHLQPVPSTQPVTHLHPVSPPQAIGQVEYHGTTNFINLRGQVPGNAVHNLLPNHYHLQYPQIPQAQVVPEFQIPRPAVFQQQLPQQEPVQVIHPGSTGVFPHQQQLPLDAQPHFQSLFPSQQQLPLDSRPHFQDAGQNVFQQQLPQTQTHFQVGQNNDVQHVFPQDGFPQQQSPQGNVQQEGQNVFQQQLPQTQTHFQVSQNNDVQHVFPQEGFPQQVPQQQLPQGNVQQEGQNVFQQQLPQTQTHFQVGQNNFQSDNDVQHVFPQDGFQQQEGHYQPADQVSSVQFYRPGQFQIGDQNDFQGYFYQRPENVRGGEEGGNSIQPGETDLQLPLHLPQHPGFDGTARKFQQDGSGEESKRNDGDFRPSIQLEPPYKKK